MQEFFFSEEEQSSLVEAIRQAELRTSGEIRVHVEPICKTDATVRAKEVFEALGMHATALKNGVLIYLAYESKVFAIIGDTGIHEKVKDSFWQAERDKLKHFFSQGEFVPGLLEVINDSGLKLQHFFPRASNDTNELSNEISFGA